MQNYCGLDMHKDNIFMCIMNFQVAMESTSIYWIPIRRVLSDSFDLKLVNPLFIKTISGTQVSRKNARCE